MVLIALAVGGNAAAQRRARIGPHGLIHLDRRRCRGSQSFTSFGGTVAFLSGDDGEIGVGISRYGNLSSSSWRPTDDVCRVSSRILSHRRKRHRAIRVERRWVGAGARPGPLLQFPLLGGCNMSAQTTTELGLGFGLRSARKISGTRRRPRPRGGSFKSRTAPSRPRRRANVSFAFGSPTRRRSLLNGTLGPAVGVLTRLSGASKGVVRQ